MGLPGCEISTYYLSEGYGAQFTVEARGAISYQVINQDARELLDQRIWNDLTGDFSRYARFTTNLTSLDSTYENSGVSSRYTNKAALHLSPGYYSRATVLDTMPRLVGLPQSKLAYGSLSIKGCSLTGHSYLEEPKREPTDPWGFFGVKDAQRELAVFNTCMSVAKMYNLPTPPLDIPFGYLGFDANKLKRTLSVANTRKRSDFINAQLDKVTSNGDSPAILVRLQGTPDRLARYRGGKREQSRVIKNLAYLSREDPTSYKSLCSKPISEYDDVNNQDVTDTVNEYYNNIGERLKQMLTHLFEDTTVDPDVQSRILKHIMNNSPGINGGFGAKKDVSLGGTVGDFEELFGEDGVFYTYGTKQDAIERFGRKYISALIENFTPTPQI